MSILVFLQLSSLLSTSQWYSLLKKQHNCSISMLLSVLFSSLSSIETTSLSKLKLSSPSSSSSTLIKTNTFYLSIMITNSSPIQKNYLKTKTSTSIVVSIISQSFQLKTLFTFQKALKMNQFYRLNRKHKRTMNNIEVGIV